MWWRWTIFVIGALLVLSCIISTTIDWIKGKTGPFGPNPENWWGCGIFTVIVIIIMAWIGKDIIR